MKKLILLLALYIISATCFGCKSVEDNPTDLSSATNNINSNANSSYYDYGRDLDELLYLYRFLGADGDRYPDKYDGKLFTAYGYVLETREKSILITHGYSYQTKDDIKEMLLLIRYGLLDQNSAESKIFFDKTVTIEIPYINDKSPRLLVGDYVKFNGTAHAKIVGTSVKKSIDSITKMEIIEEIDKPEVNK